MSDNDSATAAQKEYKRLQVNLENALNAKDVALSEMEQGCVDFESEMLRFMNPGMDYYGARALCISMPTGKNLLDVWRSATQAHAQAETRVKLAEAEIQFYISYIRAFGN